MREKEGRGGRRSGGEGTDVGIIGDNGFIQFGLLKEQVIPLNQQCPQSLLKLLHSLYVTPWYHAVGGERDKRMMSIPSSNSQL